MEKCLPSGDDNKVRLWNAATGESLTTFIGHISKVDNLAFSPDGSTLTSASRDGTVLYWNIKTGDQLPQNITEHTADVRALSFMNDSSTLASVGYGGVIALWNLDTGQTTTHHTKTAFEDTMDLAISPTLAFSPDGSILFSHGYQKDLSTLSGRTFFIRLTEVSTGRELTTLTYSKEMLSHKLTFSPDGKTTAYGVHNNEYGKIRLWNIETDKTLDIQFADRSEWIRALAFSPDGEKLATGTNKGKVQLWDAETGTELTTFFGKQPRELRSIMDLTFSSDGSLIAVINMRRICLLGSPKQPHFKEVFPDPEVFWNGAVFSPDNTVLITSLLGGGVQLRDVTTGKVLTTLDGHTASVQTLVFSPDGKTLVSAGYDGTILLWDWDEVLKGIKVGE